MLIELVYDRGCPNVERARATIRAALREVGAELVWAEWDRASSKTPANRRRFGSPTVLVNGLDVGCDVGDSAHVDANACRVYLDGTGRLRGAPSAHAIASAIAAQRI